MWPHFINSFQGVPERIGHSAGYVISPFLSGAPRRTRPHRRQRLMAVAEGGRREGGRSAYSHPLATVGRRARSFTSKRNTHVRRARATRTKQKRLHGGRRLKRDGAPRGTRPRREAAASRRCRNGRAAGGRLTTTRRFRRDAAPLQTTNPRGHCQTAPQRDHRA